MRDATTLAAVLQEARVRLRNARLAITNRRESLALAERDEAECIAEIEQIRVEMNAAADDALTQGAAEPKGDSVFAEPPEDAAVTAAFDRATTPQDGGFTNGAEF